MGAGGACGEVEGGGGGTAGREGGDAIVVALGVAGGLLVVHVD